jgi:Cdc6-like AAA superfamily ATPase
LESVIGAEEVWGKVMTNLPSLNEHIDLKVSQAIQQISRKDSNKIGIAIKGDRGTGKSHVIHRIWRNVQSEGSALFSYIPPCDDPANADMHIRLNLCNDLQKADDHGITQWQKLAASIIGSLDGTEYETKRRELINRACKPENLRKYILATVPRADLESFFNDLVEEILEVHSNLDFDFLKASLFTLLRITSPANIALSWIRGENHPQIKITGLPECDSSQQASRSIQVIHQICKLSEISSKPVIICFDQLDTWKPDAITGNSKAQTVASCIDRIYFQCSNVILMCCCIMDTWNQISQMGSGIPDRVGEWQVSAKPPTADQIIELVKLRLKWFYDKNNLNVEDYPELYPFDVNELRKVSALSSSARDLFKKWCIPNFEIDKPIHLDEETLFMNTFDEVKTKISTYKGASDDHIANIICSSLEKIIGETSGNVTVQEVTRVSGAARDLNMIISGYDSLHKKEVKIGIRVCETTQGATFTAAMKQLLDYEKYGLTRGCLVRSKALPPGWRKGRELEAELKKKGGEVVSMKASDLKSIAALERIYSQSQDYGFKPEIVDKFTKSLRLVANNTLIDEILSAPD